MSTSTSVKIRQRNLREFTFLLFLCVLRAGTDRDLPQDRFGHLEVVEDLPSCPRYRPRLATALF